LYGNLINSIHRGARLGKLYLRSAATGVGKSRSLIADACIIGCNERYVDGKWISNGTQESVMFITTEQQLDEIQTMMLAFISDVNEDHIIDNTYQEGELERVLYAGKIIKNSPIHVKRLPDFGLKDIEDTIMFGIREYGVQYFFHDYIHSSMKILSEITGKAGVKGLREDNVLFMIAVRLKDLAVENDIFIETATQLNAEYRNAQIYDQNLLRGAKSIADKIDCGMIMLTVSQEDKEALKNLIETNGFPIPDTKISVYKNRRGKFKDVLLWCDSNKGTCKITPRFVTNYQYELIEIPELKINVIPKKPAEIRL
jgi:replicative DNA helicase